MEQPGFHFTFQNLKDQLKRACKNGYTFITCQDYYNKKKSGLPDKTVVLRVDVDYSIHKAARLCEIFNSLNLKSTFFIRLHAPEYNFFSFEAYKIIRRIIDSGHEIGYHSEIIDQSVIWSEPPEKCLVRDIDILNRIYNINVVGVASHGGRTGLNNLDFWKNHRPADFNLLYETYDSEPAFNLFYDSFYISDSEWVRWKCYDKGKLVAGDNRTFGEHTDNHHSLIHLLIHPDTYFDTHFYE